MRRVVVTGLGMVSPLGSDLDSSWRRLISSESAARPITSFDPSKLTTQFACEVLGKDQNGTFNPDDWVSPKERKRSSRFILLGMAAGIQAIEDSGWQPKSEEDLDRTGVFVGSGVGGLEVIYENSVKLVESGPRRVSPFFIPGSLVNLISGHLSIRYGFRGPNCSVVTACSTSAHAIGEAARIIRTGDADVMVAGGAEATIMPLGIAGFNACRALSSRNDDPQGASRPWSEGRDGFVMGEGSGIVVLEEYEHAKARGAKIYSELLGYGLSGDAYHITAPHEGGIGALRSMQMALKNSGLNVDDIDYINAHGTSTPLGDAVEFQAVKKLFGSAVDGLCMSSTKSSIGHLLGAAGAVEAIFSILAINKGIVPPTLNLNNVSENCTGIDLVPNVAQERKIKRILSNSFGFGGTNASLVIGEV